MLVLRFTAPALIASVAALSIGCMKMPPDILSDELRFRALNTKVYSAEYEQGELDSSTPGYGLLYVKINGERVVRVSELTREDIPIELEAGVMSLTWRGLPCTRVWIGDGAVVCMFHGNKLISASFTFKSEHAVLCDKDGNREIILPVTPDTLKARLGKGNYVIAHRSS